MSAQQPEPAARPQTAQIAQMAQAATEGQLPYEATVTAPTEWVPYVYTNTEILRVVGRRRLSAAALAFGVLGLLFSLFSWWGGPLSLIAVVLVLCAAKTEPLAKTLWACALASGLVGLTVSAGWLVLILQVAPKIGY
jgi:hypothetical protein